jgi:ACR3 family arsenite transporter
MSNQETKSIGFFEKYLTIWVTLCIGAGILLGHFAGDSIDILSKMELYKVNLPIAVLIWLMIYPMMLQIDFSSIKDIKKRPKGIILTVIVNWIIKPFTMAFLAWIFFTKLYGAWIDPTQVGEYIAGAIILGAAPCTAMVLPYDTLISSVAIFVVIPLVAGWLTQKILIGSRGHEWFENSFLPKFKPVSIIALLATLILLFAFQGQNIISNPLIILLVAVPLIIQTYFIFFIAWFAGRKLNLPHPICAPAAMIGASNFFELAVAVAIALFGLHSPAALVTVVGVLVEVPVMLSLVTLANKWKY